MVVVMVMNIGLNVIVVAATMVESCRGISLLQGVLHAT